MNKLKQLSNGVIADLIRNRKTIKHYSTTMRFRVKYGMTEQGNNHSTIQPFNCSTAKRLAFTLAEVLITLAIIGVVAVLTIPTLVKNYQQKSWTTASSVFEKKLNQALKVMNVQDTLAGKNNTGAFLDELSKNFKITKVCDLSELEQCFVSSIDTEIMDFDVSDSQSMATFLLSDIKTNNTLRNTPYLSGVKGVVFGNGITALVEYNPDCKRDPYNNQYNGLDCLAILYDVNGLHSPNVVGRDIFSLKTKMSGSVKFGGKTWSEPKVADTPLSYDECLKTKDNLGIKNCVVDYWTDQISDNDYWGGAVKECGGVENLPTPSDLKQLAESIGTTSDFYDSSKKIWTCDTYPNCLDKDKAQIFYNALKIDNTSNFYIWSNEEIDAIFSKRTLFYPTSYTNNTRIRTDKAYSIVMCKSE